jgi:hypothetical protein
MASESSTRPQGGAYIAGDLKVGGHIVAESFQGYGAKQYAALLTQATTAAPTAAVLFNSFSADLVWSYVTTGNYTGTLTGAFTSNKTGVVVQPDIGTVGAHVQASRADADTVNIRTQVGSTNTDGLLTGAFVQVLVYP